LQKGFAANRQLLPGQSGSKHRADTTVTLPQPPTSGAKAAGRFGKRDFVYVAAQDIYRCPAGEGLTYRFTGHEDGKMLRRCWTNACQNLRARSSVHVAQNVDPGSNGDPSLVGDFSPG
jgi:hypothetical protein